MAIRFPNESTLFAYLETHPREGFQLPREINELIANFFAEQSLKELDKLENLLVSFNTCWWRLPLVYLNSISTVVKEILKDCARNKPSNEEKKSQIEHRSFSRPCIQIRPAESHMPTRRFSTARVTNPLRTRNKTTTASSTTSNTSTYSSK